MANKDGIKIMKINVAAFEIILIDSKIFKVLIQNVMDNG